MPQQQALPTWVALNNMNNVSQSGQTDPVTGFPYAGGGLNAGDYFDLTTEEAASASYTTNGTCFSGRYRYVLVDSGATAANVKTGTVGYIRAGSTISAAITTNIGTGLTNGSYQVAATPGSGGGSGAIIAINVSGGVIVGNPTVVATGFGYVSVPSFSLTALGGSAAAVVAQLNTTPNFVTSADQALSTNAAAAANGPVRPIVFLNSVTPGNYGFIQELGIATVLDAASTVQTVGYFATVASGGTPNGTMTTSVTTPTNYSIGQVIDAVASTTIANVPFKILMGITATVVQD